MQKSKKSLPRSGCSCRNLRWDHFSAHFSPFFQKIYSTLQPHQEIWWLVCFSIMRQTNAGQCAHSATWPMFSCTLQPDSGSAARRAPSSSVSGTLISKNSRPTTWPFSLNYPPIQESMICEGQNLMLHSFVEGKHVSAMMHFSENLLKLILATFKQLKAERGAHPEHQL